MTKTIPQLDPATLPANPSSLVEISIPGGGSRKIAIADMSVSVIQITTSGSPVVVTPDTDALGTTIYQITSGGTAGDEYIHLLAYPDTTDDGAPGQVGKSIQFVMNEQTDPADTVHTLLYSSDGNFLQPQYILNALAQRVGGVDPDLGGVLDYDGALIIYDWNYDGWYFDARSADNDSDTTIQRNQFPQANGYEVSSGSGNAALIRAGNAKSGSGQAGGVTNLWAGNSDGTSNGGAASLKSGNGGTDGDTNGGDFTITLGNGHGAGSSGHWIMSLDDFADDAAAAAGGVPVNGWYRTASVTKVRVA